MAEPPSHPPKPPSHPSKGTLLPPRCLPAPGALTGSGAQRHLPCPRSGSPRADPTRLGPSSELSRNDGSSGAGEGRGDSPPGSGLPGGPQPQPSPLPHRVAAGPGGPRLPGPCPGRKAAPSPPLAGEAAPGSRGPRVAAGPDWVRPGSPEGKRGRRVAGRARPGPTCVHGGPAEAAAAADSHARRSPARLLARRAVPGQWERRSSLAPAPIGCRWFRHSAAPRAAVCGQGAAMLPYGPAKQSAGRQRAGGGAGAGDRGRRGA